MHKRYKILASLFLSIFLLLAFTPPLNPTAGGWTQQFMPNLGGRTIQDITFVDSLTGYASANTSTDSSYILKTTNGGDNWQIIYRQLFYMTRLQFLNLDTGYAGGAYVYKTTNGGLNWSIISSGLGVSAVDISVLNMDTIWFVDDNSFTGGVFFTGNGGANWDRQFTIGTSHIYMYNARIGFIDGGGLKKTTDGGFTWTPIAGEGLFFDMFFIDSLTGWKTDGNMKKTTDGGLTWISQILPLGGNISIFSQMKKFVCINKDTLWGSGGYLNFSGGRNRGFIYHTLNGGLNWTFQIPDTSFGVPQFDFINFINKKNGWCYETYYSQQVGSLISVGVHTTTGGNDTFYTELQNTSSNTPEQFKLYQNYPNPFNSQSIIMYELKILGYVRILVYDICGREVVTLVNEKQGYGTYEVGFSGNGLSSGVYFYKIIINSGKEVFSDTKKMILLK